MKLDKEITYAELYFTLRCNLSCPYCINGHEEVKRVREEQDVDKLCDAINSVDFGDLSLTVGGGEPTVRKDFYRFMQGLKPEIKVDLLTNLQFNVGEFVNELGVGRFTTGRGGAYKSIRVSYHPSQMDAQELVDKAAHLQDSGFSVGIFGIMHPENIGANIQMAELARKSKVYFFVKEYLGEYGGKLYGTYKYIDALRGERKNVACKSSELLIGPDGNIYKCHRDLYLGSDAVGSIYDGKDIESKFRTCAYYGLCNPCDIKSKVDRHLNRGRCSVEIERRAPPFTQGV